MRRIFLSVALAVVTTPALAQSWSYDVDRAIAPAALDEEHVRGLEILCHSGERVLYVLTAVGPDEDAPATFIIDGQSYMSQFGRYLHGDMGILLTDEIIAALKRGSRVAISFPSGGVLFDATFALRGSSRALSAFEAGCASPTPASAPDRFLPPPGSSTSEAITLASTLFRPMLEEAHKTDPQVGIQSAGFIDLENGWRFLVSDLGPSTSLYGIVGFVTPIAARPPSGDWQIVDTKVGAAVYIDSQNMTSGYPDIVYQNVRGVNQPRNVWTWNGSAYVHSRAIEN